MAEEEQPGEKDCCQICCRWPSSFLLRPLELRLLRLTLCTSCTMAASPLLELLKEIHAYVAAAAAARASPLLAAVLPLDFLFYFDIQPQKLGVAVEGGHCL